MPYGRLAAQLCFAPSVALTGDQEEGGGGGGGCAAPFYLSYIHACGVVDHFKSKTSGPNPKPA